MKIFVTGATGFIGSHLVEELIRKKKIPPTNIFVLVRQTSDISFLKRLKVNLVFGSLEDKKSFVKTLSQAELIFHLAAQAHLGEPKESYVINVQGTKNILDGLSQNKKRPRLVFLSSICAVDRKPQDDCRIPVNENYPPSPQTAYGRSKLEAECLIVREAKEVAFDYVILRAPLVFGPRNRLNSAVSSFILGIEQCSPLYAFNFPGAFSLIYVKDLARALMMVGENPKAVNQVFFVANSEPVKVPTLFNKIAKILGVKRQVFPLPRWAFNIVYDALSLKFIPKYKLNIFKRFWVCSTKKIETLIGFQTRYSLDEALEQTIDWYNRQGWVLKRREILARKR